VTPAELKSARERLGLSTAGLAEALRMGKGGGRHIRKLEAGQHPISGPIAVAVELMLERAVHYLDPPPLAGDLLVMTLVEGQEGAPLGCFLCNGEPRIAWKISDGTETHFPAPVARAVFGSTRDDQE
jgi:hypothetical protein